MILLAMFKNQFFKLDFFGKNLKMSVDMLLTKKCKVLIYKEIFSFGILNRIFRSLFSDISKRVDFRGVK